MSSTTSTAVQKEDVVFGRLWWVGLLTILIADIAVALVRTITVAVLPISPNFAPLTLPPNILFTTIGAIGATIVFAIVSRVARRPISLFRWIALVVLLLSFIPDVLLLTAKPPAFAGTTLLAVSILVVLHIVAAIAIVVPLTTLARGTAR